jgi:streptogramin lyase
MKTMKLLCRGMLGPLMLLAFAACAPKITGLEGYGQLTGNVTGSEPGVLPVVYAYNMDKDVAYTVFVVDGKYRAVNLIPGHYDVTIRAAVDQLEGFDPVTVEVDVTADANFEVDFVLENVGLRPNYITGLPAEACSANRPSPEIAAKLDYALKHGGIEPGKAIGDCEDSLIQPFEDIFPAGEGREILLRTCLGCHHPQTFAYNIPKAWGGGRAKKNREAWAYNVDRKITRIPGRSGLLGQATHIDPKLLPPRERDILVDYLADNFGVDAPSRLVELRTEPELDLEALEKAQFIEYIWKENPDPEQYSYWPWPHRSDFDKDGNVWLSYYHCCPVKFDPRTGESKAYENPVTGDKDQGIRATFGRTVGNRSTYGIAVDDTDGTVWFSNANRLDPETGLVDRWTGFVGGGSIALDSEANVWFAQPQLAKYDRKTESMWTWSVPIERCRPYGMIIDYTDKIWVACYHSSSVARFDPDTETWKNFRITDEEPTDIRRLGVDSKNMIWTANYGGPNREVDGHNKGGNIYRLDPETGDVREWSLGIEFSKPYNAEADPDDNIWTNPDNYLVRFNQETETFTRYPIPTRSDLVKTRITRDGAVWTHYRNAGHYVGYGAVAAVLYPDKDKMPTLGAYHHENSAGNHETKYQGPALPKVTGKVTPVPDEVRVVNKMFGMEIITQRPRNQEAFEEWALANGLPELNRDGSRIGDTE